MLGRHLQFVIAKLLAALPLSRTSLMAFRWSWYAVGELQRLVHALPADRETEQLGSRPYDGNSARYESPEGLSIRLLPNSAGSPSSSRPQPKVTSAAVILATTSVVARSSRLRSQNQHSPTSRHCPPLLESTSPLGAGQKQPKDRPRQAPSLWLARLPLLRDFTSS